MKRRKVPDDGQNQICAELLTFAGEKRGAKTLHGVANTRFSRKTHLRYMAPVAIAALCGNAYF